MEKIGVCSGGVVFRKIEGKIYFLLIRCRTSGWWVFPKGHVENEDNLLQTALREIYEETGLNDLQQIHDYLEIISFINHKGNKKNVHHYLFKTEKEKIILSEEHTEFKWLSFSEAYNLVDHENQKRILKFAYEKIKNG